MTEITLADFRARLEEHLARVAQDGEEVVVTGVADKAVAVLPLAELRSLQETLHLLSDPTNADRLRRSVRELEAGRGTERALVER